MENNLKKSDFITLCPYCHPDDSKPPHHFLFYDPDRPGIGICEVHGERPIGEFFHDTAQRQK